MITCNFCKTEIHTEAETCPNCHANKLSGITVWQSIIILNLTASIITFLSTFLGATLVSSVVFGLIGSLIVYAIAYGYYRDKEYWVKEHYVYFIIRNIILIMIPIFAILSGIGNIFSAEIVTKISDIVTHNQESVEITKKQAVIGNRYDQ